jgi:dihydrodipicolinate synthase/N-acetylneuraminate lyase
MTRFAAARAALMQRVLPDGPPALWCPLLTHYTPKGAIDKERTRRHLDYLQSSVRGYLVPGSTGDGWELRDDEIRALLDFMVDEVHARGLHVLIGVLKTSAPEMLRDIDDTLAWLRRRSGASDDLAALERSSVCGFTVCPPQGAALTQAEIESALDAVLALGVPASLYQLPQVTENEMAPDTVRRLASRHANFLLLKDTSGADRVAASGLRDVFLVRGAEGGYSSHLWLAGGAYDGFLLSTANCFGPQLARMIEDLRAGRRAQADDFSQRLSRLVDEVFGAAAKLPHGNAFSNANKAIDHFMAHGPHAHRVAPPRLHAGVDLPADFIGFTGAALARQALMPASGYLD